MEACGHKDFDALILRTLLTDGEVFIRVHHPSSSLYGLSFELVDSMSIDFTKRKDFSNGTAIINGVEIDQSYRPVKYYVRQGNLFCYQAGKEEVVPASEMIHIYKREYPRQPRGIPPFNAVLQDIKNLDDYRMAEILAAKASSCIGGIYERNNLAVQGDFIDGATYDDKRRVRAEA